MIEIVQGDILESNAKYICHQCNCITTYAAGLAKQLFIKFPYADSYSKRMNANTLGTIEVFGNGIENRYIINIYSQYYPGNAKSSGFDSAKERRNAFYKALNRIAEIPNIGSIAFPYGIGCGLAGGDWNYYEGVINNFAKFVYFKDKTKTFLYKL